MKAKGLDTRDAWKTKNRFGFFKIQTVQKFDIHSDGFSTETACNPQFKLKVTKITLLAFSVRMKNVLKLYWTNDLEFVVG